MHTPFLRFRSAALFLAFGLLAVPPVVRAQVDDFNDGNDNGWTRNDPLGGLGAGPIVSFAVTNGQYRITSVVSPNPGQAGPARGASLRQDRVYSRFCVAVDIVGIGDGVEPVVGLLARIQPNPGLQNTNGYALTLQPADNDIQISRVDSEVATGVSSAVPLSPAYDPGRSYRLVFVGNGDYLEGAVFDLADLTTPLARATAFDAVYAEGTAGLVIYDNSTGGASTSGGVFDNYRADDGNPPPLEIFLSEDNEVSLRWPEHALCHVLQESDSLATGEWFPVVSDIFHLNGSLQYFLGIPQIPEGFFRLALPGSP